MGRARNPRGGKRGAAPRVSADAFPLVRSFVRGYLHEDWALDYGSVAEARHAFVGECEPAQRAAFHDECARLADAVSKLDLAGARRVFTEVLGSAWRPATRADIDTLLAGGPDRP